MQNANARTKFNIEEYKAKIVNSLETLKATKKPGERTGEGNKTAVLEQSREVIEAMISEGYSSKQIADAISTDVFKILPKTITQIIDGGKKQNQKTRKPKNKAETSTATDTTTRLSTDTNK